MIIVYHLSDVGIDQIECIAKSTLVKIKLYRKLRYTLYMGEQFVFLREFELEL